MPESVFASHLKSALRAKVGGVGTEQAVRFITGCPSLEGLPDLLQGARPHQGSPLPPRRARTLLLGHKGTWLSFISYCMPADARAKRQQVHQAQRPCQQPQMAASDKMKVLGTKRRSSTRGGKEVHRKDRAPVSAPDGTYFQDS